MVVNHESMDGFEIGKILMIWIVTYHYVLAIRFFLESTFYSLLSLKIMLYRWEKHQLLSVIVLEMDTVSSAIETASSMSI